MKVELAKHSDIGELAQLYDALNDYMASTINYPGWIKGVYPVRETAEKGIEENGLFVMKINDKIVASVILSHTPGVEYKLVKWGKKLKDEEVIIVRVLAVHPECLQMGIGLQLMLFVEEYAALQEMKAIRLDLSVDNKPAISLYEKLGYKLIDEIPGSKGEDTIRLYEKELG